MSPTFSTAGYEHLLPLLEESHGYGRRGLSRRVTLPSGERVVHKHYFRGGGMGFLGDRYASPKRLRTEVDVLRYLWDKGIAVPRFLVARAKRSRWGWYRLDMLTKEIPDAKSMWDLLIHLRGSRRARFIRATAAAVRRMHDAGVFHGDLTVENILDSPSGIHILDFDQSRRLHPFPLSMRNRDLRRMRRSAVKRKLAFSRSDVVRFALAYSGGDKSLLPLRLETVRLG